MSHSPGDARSAEPAGARRYEGDELELFAHARNWKAYWSSVIAPHVGRNVLDVGAGIGATAEAFGRQQCARWVALEPDPDLGARIRNSVRSGALPGHVEVRCGTLRDVAPEDRFDTILYVDVLEHIENDAAELELAARHLAPQGFLIIVAPAHNWLYTPFDRAIGHYRRYSRRTMGAIVPAALEIAKLRYLDSVGMLASLGNRLLLQSASPTLSQIRFWDRVLVPASRIIDPCLFGRVGKSIACVMRRRAPQGK